MKELREANRIGLLRVSRCAARQRQPRPIRRRFEIHFSIFSLFFFKNQMIIVLIGWRTTSGGLGAFRWILNEFFHVKSPRWDLMAARFITQLM